MGTSKLSLLRGLRAFVVCGAVSASLGCTKGVPTFTNLESDSLPQPTFLGATSVSKVAASKVATLSISGECDSKISNLLAQPIGATGSQSSLITTYASSVTVACSSTGTFSFTLKSLVDLGFSNPVADQTYDIELRGLTTAGFSRASVIHVLFSPAGGAPRMILTSGATESSTTGNRRLATSDLGNFNAHIRVDHRINLSNVNAVSGDVVKTSTAASPSFKMKIGAAAEAN